MEDYKEILNKIKNTDNIEETVNEIKKNRIEEAREENDNINFFGLVCDKYKTEAVDTNLNWMGFIPEDVKIGYGYAYIYNDTLDKEFYSDNGYYYYIDNDDYLYEFIDYIKDKEINDETDFIMHTYAFIENYYSGRKQYTKNREEFYSPLYDSFMVPIKNCRKHSLSDFKQRGIAECTEYASLANNILSFFGFSICILDGEIICSSSNSRPGLHSFNIISFNGDDYLLDMSCAICCYNLTNDDYYSLPFLEKIGISDEVEFNENDKLVFNEYFALDMFDNINFFQAEDEVRVYSFTFSDMKQFDEDNYRIYLPVTENELKNYSLILSDTKEIPEDECKLFLPDNYTLSDNNEEKETNKVYVKNFNV